MFGTVQPEIDQVKVLSKIKFRSSFENHGTRLQNGLKSELREI